MKSLSQKTKKRCNNQVTRRFGKYSFYHFWPKNDGEKWHKINIFEIARHGKPLLDPFIYFIKRRILPKTKNSVAKMHLFPHEGISIKKVSIKQVGPNKRVWWIFYVNFLNK